MKQPTEKPAEQVMRFFTRELYRQFNAPDDEEADRANAMWETAIEKYRQHLDDIRDRMPSQVRKLTDICLHDAEVLALNQESQALIPPPEPSWPVPFWSAIAILSLRHEGKVWSLIYLLWDRVREHPAPGDWPFSKTAKHWLYDEVDLAADRRGMFLHRILFSDGGVLEVPFYSVICSNFALPAMEGDRVSRQIA